MRSRRARVAGHAATVVVRPFRPAVRAIVVSVPDEADTAVDQLCEGRGELHSHDTVSINVEPVEEGEVEPATGVVVGADVEPVAALEQTKGDRKPFLDQAVVDVGQLEQPLGVALFSSECLLAALEIVDGDSAGQMRPNGPEQERPSEVGVRLLLDAEEQQPALELAQRVWDEKGYGSLSEYDRYLRQSRLFGAFDGEQCVGVVQLILGAPLLPPFISAMPFDDATLKDLLTKGCHAARVEELGVAAVDGKTATTFGVVLSLYRAAYRDACARGSQIWGVIMEPPRVELMMRRYGFLFRQLGCAIHYQGGQCAAHALDLRQARREMQRTHPAYFHWFTA